MHLGLLLGCILSVLVLGVFMIALYHGQPDANALTFTCLILGNLGLIILLERCLVGRCSY